MTSKYDQISQSREDNKFGSPIETESNEPSSTGKSRANQPGFVVFWPFANAAQPGSSDREARDAFLAAGVLARYSYRRLSTGSNWEARVAGTVPKMIPTMDETKIAIIAESPEIGIR